MLRLIELGLAAFAFIILTGTNAYYFLLGVPAGLTAQESLAYAGNIQNVFLLAYVIVVLLAIANWQRMILGLAAVWPIAVLIAIAWLSNFWTVTPDLTFQRCIALTVTTLMGVYLFACLEFETFLRFMTGVISVLVIGCLVWVFLVPDYGLHSDETHAGLWRGIFFHKNTTGRVMIFSLAVLSAAWIGSGINRGYLLFIGALAVLVALGTTSQTALLGLMVLVGGVGVVRMVRGQALKSALITLVVLALAWHGALVLFTTYEVVLEALGRDPSLTGRTDIWVYAFRAGLDQPLTGYGYDAFWNGDYSPGANYSATWNTPHSHNAWLEIFIGLGLPAALLMVGIMIVTTFRATILARYHPSTAPGILIMLTSFAIMTVSMSEPVFLERHSFEWILVVAIVGCARALTSSLGREQLTAEDDPERLPPAGERRLRPTTAGPIRSPQPSRAYR